ncbi:hypothetical protein [Intrasporangium sp. DVR]|uniref:hypothetical protein n=1 Tax=Intrasporangium sp. DVR TaxID=3127867 RepID=UPI00313A5AFD
MSDFDHTPSEIPEDTGQPPRGGDPSVDEVPPEPTETDVERGSVDGSAKENPVLEGSLEDAGDVRGVPTHQEARPGEDDPAVS